MRDGRAIEMSADTAVWERVALEHILLTTIASAGICAASKYIFWVNAKIFLGLAKRSVGKNYWKFTTIEAITLILFSTSFSVSIIYRLEGTFVPFVFMVSALFYLGYMIRRVWVESDPDVAK